MVNTKHMNTYTFVVEIEGGTYVSQVQASNKRAALLAWCEAVRAEKLLAHRTTRLVNAILRDGPELVALSDLEGAWCFTASFANRLVLGHIILSAGAIRK